MPSSPEGPVDPLKVQRDLLRKEVMRLRQMPKAFGNSEIQDRLTDINNMIRDFDDEVNFILLDALLREVRDRLQ